MRVVNRTDWLLNRSEETMGVHSIEVFRITFRIGDRVYRTDNPDRIGFIRNFVMRKRRGRPHCYAMVIVSAGRRQAQELWRADRCRPASETRTAS